MATATERLTAEQQERRDALYAGIDRTRPAADDIEQLAAYLEEIRDSRLYREEFETFEQCCRHRWGWSRQRVAQIIKAGQVIKNICQQIVDTPKPKNESQTRALGKVEPEHQGEVWQESRERYGDDQPPASFIQATARDMFPVEPDDPEPPQAAEPNTIGDWEEALAALTEQHFRGQPDFMRQIMRERGVAVLDAALVVSEQEAAP